MRAESNVAVRAGKFVLLGALFVYLPAAAQVGTPTNITVRVMASNLTGNSQKYEPPQIRILQGLHPDVVALQEFKYSNSTAQDIRAFVDEAFGTNFVYFRETNSSYSIPNGVISRWPITNSGSWDDPKVNDRGFAWAQIDLPGTNDLYVVSCHLYSSGTATDRDVEANAIKTNIQTFFPANAWVIVAGDFNTATRSEAAVDTFKTFLSDSPIPTDPFSGDPDTNLPRNHPYDYVLPSFSLTNSLTNVVIASHSFPNGLVFVSTNYTPLSEVSPVQYGDSTNGQHMGVVKDFRITYYVTNSGVAPVITNQPQSLTVTQGNNATFTVVAGGTASLNYQWRFTTTNIAGATTSSYTRSNAQPAQAGDYFVVITNTAGSMTSDVATLTVRVPPSITTQPTNQTVIQGSNATFIVSATGTDPLGYQWRFTTTNIAGATTSSYTRTNTQPAHAGDYSVVITNIAGSVTSSPATLTVIIPPGITMPPQDQVVNQAMNATFTVTASGSPTLIYQWRFNAMNIIGATASEFTRSNAQPADVGNYSVLVTNVGGSVTSPAAALNLEIPPPSLTMPSADTLQWQGLSNLNYTVQTKTNVDDTNWNAIGTASSPTTTISFTNSSADAPQRFYRVVYP